MSIDPRNSMIDALRDRDYRHSYVASHITEGLALQIRALRESRPWTQVQLGDRAGMSQVAISRLEDPDYGRFTLNTLRRLAQAFDVALIVRFAPFSELVDWTLGLSPEALSPPDFEHDAALTPRPYIFDDAEMMRLLAPSEATSPSNLLRFPISYGTTERAIREESTPGGIDYGTPRTAIAN